MSFHVTTVLLLIRLVLYYYWYMCGENVFLSRGSGSLHLSAPLINNFPKPRLMMIETTVNNFMIRMPESNKCLLDSRWLADFAQRSKQGGVRIKNQSSAS